MASSLTPGRKPRKPPLYRLARILRWSGTLTAILLILYVVAALYALGTQPPNFSGSSNSSQSGNNGGCGNVTSGAMKGSIVCTFNVTNRVPYPLSVTLAGKIAEVPGPTLADGTSPVVTVSSGATAEIILAMNILTSPSNGSKYVEWMWLNATYAYVFTASVGVEQNGTFQGVALAPADHFSAKGMPGPFAPSVAGPRALVEPGASPIQAYWPGHGVRYGLLHAAARVNMGVP